MSSLKAKLQESNPDQVEDFMAKAPEAVKKILKNFKNYQVTTVPSVFVCRKQKCNLMV